MHRVPKPSPLPRPGPARRPAPCLLPGRRLLQGRTLLQPPGRPARARGTAPRSWSGPRPPETLGAGESRVSVFPPSPQPVAASGACCGPGLRRPHQNTGVCEDFLNYFEKPVSSFFLFLFFLPLAVARDHVRRRTGPGRRPCWALQEITPNPPRDNAQSALTLQSPARAPELPQCGVSPGAADGTGEAEKAQPAFETRPPGPDARVLGS